MTGHRDGCPVDAPAAGGSPPGTLLALFRPVALQGSTDLKDNPPHRNYRPTSIDHWLRIWRIQLVPRACERTSPRPPFAPPKLWHSRERWISDYLRALQGITHLEGSDSSNQADHLRCPSPTILEPAGIRGQHRGTCSESHTSSDHKTWIELGFFTSVPQSWQHYGPAME